MLPATPTPDEWCPVGATIPRSQIESLASCQLDEPDVVPVQDEHRSQTAGRTGLIFTVAVKIGLGVNMAESRFLSTYRTSPDRKETSVPDQGCHPYEIGDECGARSRHLQLDRQASRPSRPTHRKRPAPFWPAPTRTMEHSRLSHAPRQFGSAVPLDAAAVNGSGLCPTGQAYHSTPVKRREGAKAGPAAAPVTTGHGDGARVSRPPAGALPACWLALGSD